MKTRLTYTRKRELIPMMTDDHQIVFVPSELRAELNINKYILEIDDSNIVTSIKREEN